MALNWTLYAYISALSGVLASLLGIASLYRNSASRTNRYFSLTLFAVALWSFGELLQRVTPLNQAGDALLWSNVSIAGAILIPVFFIHFAYAITNRRPSPRVSVAVLLVAFFLYVFLALGWLQASVSAEPRLFAPAFWSHTMPGPAYSFYLLYIAAGTIGAFLVVLRFYQGSRGSILAPRVRYFLIGSFIPIAYGIFDALVNVFGIFLPFGSLSTFAFVIGAVFLAYSVFYFPAAENASPTAD